VKASGVRPYQIHATRGVNDDGVIVAVERQRVYQHIQIARTVKGQCDILEGITALDQRLLHLPGA
jgi:hypothetical protein